jgi:hypothetical protein
VLGGISKRSAIHRTLTDSSQLGKLGLYKAEVGGSIPPPPTNQFPEHLCYSRFPGPTRKPGR